MYNYFKIFFQAKDIFREIEIDLGEELPKFVVDVLKTCAFTNITSLKEINSEIVNEIEEFCNENQELLSNSMIGTVYEHMKPFKFLPGHRLLILKLPKYCEDFSTETPSDDLPSDSTAMRALKENARVNLSRAESGKRYNMISKTYAIYLYLMAGKACYESICANLPLPKADTVCECFYTESIS